MKQNKQAQVKKPHAAIGKRIKDSLKKNNLKQKDIQELTGASAGSISLWVNGHSKPQDHYLDSLANHLAIDKEWLLTGVTAKTEEEADTEEMGEITESTEAGVAAEKVVGPAVAIDADFDGTLPDREDNQTNPSSDDDNIRTNTGYEDIDTAINERVDSAINNDDDEKSEGDIWQERCEKLRAALQNVVEQREDELTEDQSVFFSRLKDMTDRSRKEHLAFMEDMDTPSTEAQVAYAMMQTIMIGPKEEQMGFMVLRNPTDKATEAELGHLITSLMEGIEDVDSALGYMLQNHPMRGDEDDLDEESIFDGLFSREQQHELDAVFNSNHAKRKAKKKKKKKIKARKKQQRKVIEAISDMISGLQEMGDSEGKQITISITIG